jgi:Gram-negative bacterial TonB protein C-terminal
MKKIILLFFLLLNLVVNAQEDKTVTLTVSGTGKTIEEAKTNALRSAIEQAFGAFISSKTEILNDNLIKDEIVSVANGNIQSFDILDKTQLLDNNWSTTIKAVVSVNKLISFVESKGITVEIKGGLFALNIKQQLINEENEVRTIVNLSKVLFEYMQKSFDYDIKSSEPRSLDNNSQKWELPIIVTSKTNSNIESLNNYCLNTLLNISLNFKERENYVQLGKPFFKLIFKSNSEEKTFFFRKKISVNLIEILFSQIPLFAENFKIDTGLNLKCEYINSKTYKNYTHSTINKYGIEVSTIDLFANEEVAGTYNYKIIVSLSDLEKLSKLSVIGNLNRYKFELPNKINYNEITEESIFYKDNFDNNDVTSVRGKETTYIKVDVEAAPPGGMEAFYKKFASLFTPPEVDEGVSQIRILLAFVVEKDGTFTDIRVIRDGGYPDAGKEAIRVLKRMPNWKPAIINGQSVRSQYSLPFVVRTQ